jgi:integrase
MWRRTMDKAVEEERLVERFTFHDLRAKAGSDSEDDGLLGHEDSRTLRRYYKRKPLKVTPLTPKILDNR